MAGITFLFGIHNHQPIGNFGHVFEEAYQKSYLPFLEVLAGHPSIKWSLHSTGILWEWMEQNHPEYLDKVSLMVRSGQVELLSGGFYEPILSVIPDADKVGQIQKLNGYLKSHFKTEAKGMWCAERVWEPNLPKYLRQAGIEYTVLDDTHFLYSGLSSEDLTGYYRVEDEENAVDIFPISQELRYAIPFKDPEETIKIFERVRDRARGRETALVMADDGEKFGFWPGTNKLVYQEKWLDRLLTLLEQNASWISTDTFSGYRAKASALGKVYLPTASYSEMSEWSLPTAAGIDYEGVVHGLSTHPDWQKMRRFTKGGFWRNFLAKYPEADSMYKKMLYVSGKVHEAERRKKTGARAALDELWAGQCNCSYWHGAFGGLYLPFLREAIYRHLINAEKILDGKSSKGRITALDFDRDGRKEVLYESSTQNLYLSPTQGGAIFEWDFKPVSVNVANVLTRRPEVYHEKLKKWAADPKSQESGSAKSIHDLVQVKEKGLENILQYDWHRRMSLLDHFLEPSTDFESFKRSRYGEQGDFVLGGYSAELDRGGIVLERSGSVFVGTERAAIQVRKTLWPQDGGDAASIRVEYRIRNDSGRDLAGLRFAPEFNFSFTVPEKDQQLSQVSSWEKIDPHLHWKLSVSFSDKADLWIFPLETVSNSEAGFEKTFQGLVLLPHWSFDLQAGDSFERTLTFQLAKI